MTPKEAVSFRQGILGIWRHIRPYRARLLILSVLGLISAAANGAVPYVTGKFFDSLIDLSQGVVASGLPFWGMLLAVWAAIQLLANSIDWTMDRIRRELDTGLHLNIQAESFGHLLKLPLSYHANEHINGVLSSINTTSWRVTAIMRTIIQISPQILSVLIGIALAASISKPMAGVLIIGLFSYILLLYLLLRKMAPIDHQAHEAWNSTWNDAAGAVLEISTVKQATAEEYEMEKLASAIKKTSTIWKIIEDNWSNLVFFQRIIVFLTQFIIFFGSVKAVALGAMTVGELIALNGYALLFFGPFVSLGYSWQTIQNGIVAAGQLEKVFKEKPEPYNQPTRGRPEEVGKITFDSVSFQYPSKELAVLNDLSFTANSGEIVALVGESGSGKSTIIALISAYYFPTEGNVTVDGLRTQEWNPTDLRKRIAVVPQEVALFNDSIRKNILYGSFGATETQLVQAAKNAHIHDFIMNLENQYETLVGERGIKLSVGQKQRVAIARAILRNPEILILDEPTSALDPETEQQITKSLDALMKGRTTFIIAHRLSTVRKADKILVIKEGKVAEEGNHADLIKIPNGVYRHLYELHIGLHE